MTVEKAVDALVDAGLLDEGDASAAAAALAASSVEFTYPAWARALSQAKLLDEASVEAAISVMDKAGSSEAEDDPAGFEEGLESAGIL